MRTPPRSCDACRRACTPRWPWVTLVARALPGAREGATLVLCWRHWHRYRPDLPGGWVVAEWHSVWLEPSADMRAVMAAHPAGSAL